jgi:signal recognition particle receptor subunit beta
MSDIAQKPEPQEPNDRSGPEPSAVGARPAEGAAALFDLCLEGLAPFVREREEVLDLLDALPVSRDAAAAEAVARDRARLYEFEPSVTMIGQVKAGKTSLVNAMIGTPGLLPADVNPWTSVVTSLHLGPRAHKAPQAARFTFFDPEDWDRLTRKGGRVGELAARSGAEDEAEKVRRQVEAMREKTRARLGRRFELLLGTRHDYGAFDSRLVERYVCLGDDFFDDEAEDASEEQGRFADITKAADLWLPREDWPIGLCLRDTPGVNDTFLMREQITIRAIRESRLCVVVLSAHQALSSVDMALIRLISNVRSREVVIFVNRIDELSDPGTQIEEIRASIRATLAEHKGLEDVEILFGSARWATLALAGRLPELDAEAADALLAYAEHALPGTERDLGPLELVWWLSGVPALYGALWSRIVDGAARERLQAVARSAMNLATGISAAAEAEAALFGGAGAGVDAEALAARLDALEARMLDRFDTAFADALARAGQRLERSHRSFLDRATAALIRHLETAGEQAPWSYDPTGLRLLLRSGYQVFSRDVRSAAEETGAAAAKGVAALYAEALGAEPRAIDIQPPGVPRAAPPVLLGQTIALDLQGTWWRRWWSRRRGYAAFAPDFLAMIEAETRPMLDALRESHCVPAGEAARAALRDFFADQRMLLASLAERAAGGGAATEDRTRADLSAAMTRLGRLAA